MTDCAPLATVNSVQHVTAIKIECVNLLIVRRSWLTPERSHAGTEPWNNPERPPALADATGSVTNVEIILGKLQSVRSALSHMTQTEMVMDADDQLWQAQGHIENALAILGSPNVQAQRQPDSAR